MVRLLLLLTKVIWTIGAFVVHHELESLGITVKNKPFTKRHGWPEYDSYCTLAYVLMHSDNIHTWLEFGVAGGVSINITADILPRTQIIGFDTFEGLPDTWHGHFRKGAFSQDGIPPRVKRNVHLVKGLFRDTVAHVMENIGVIDGMNIDCDLFDPTLFILNETLPHWRRGTILHFHEYNDPLHKSEEQLALDTFLVHHPNVCLLRLANVPCGSLEPAVFEVC